jgi:hypothetical protein
MIRVICSLHFKGMFKNHKRPNLKLFCQSGFWLLGIKNHANNVGNSDAVAFRLCFQKVGAAYHTFHTRPAAGLHESLLLSTHHGQKRPINPALLAQATHLGIQHHHRIRNTTRKLQGELHRISHHLIINQPVNQSSTQQLSFHLL